MNRAKIAKKFAEAARARVPVWKARAEKYAEELELWLELLEARETWRKSPEYQARLRVRQAKRLERIEAEFVRKHRKPLEGNEIKSSTNGSIGAIGVA
jgi:cyclopropane fatty-acyl-phospholipid synthase-like methyltransferase